MLGILIGIWAYTILCIYVCLPGSVMRICIYPFQLLSVTLTKLIIYIVDLSVLQLYYSWPISFCLNSDQVNQNYQRYLNSLLKSVQKLLSIISTMILIKIGAHIAPYMCLNLKGANFQNMYFSLEIVKRLSSSLIPEAYSLPPTPIALYWGVFLMGIGQIFQCVRISGKEESWDSLVYYIEIIWCIYISGYKECNLIYIVNRFLKSQYIYI